MTEYELHKTDIVITHILNGLSKFKITVPNTAANRAKLGYNKVMAIKHYDDVAMKGFLGEPELSDKGLVLRGEEKAIELTNKIWTKNNSPIIAYSNTAANTILNDILSGTNFSVGSCPSTEISVRFEYTDRLSAIETLAKTLNKDWWFTYNGIDYCFIGTKGSSKGSISYLSLGKKREDPRKIQNKIHITGIDENDQEHTVVVEEDDGHLCDSVCQCFCETTSQTCDGACQKSKEIYDIHEEYYTTRACTDEDTLWRFGDAILRDFRLPKLMVPIRITEKEYFDKTLQTGDTIHVEQTRLGINVTDRIRQVEIHMSYVKLEVGYSQSRLDQELRKYKEGITITERSRKSCVHQCQVECQTAEQTAAGIASVPSGTSFPSSPSEGDLFYRTDLKKTYRYDGTEWEIVIRTTGAGTSFPDEKDIGDIFFRTDLEAPYRWNGTSWVQLRALSRSGTSFPAYKEVGDFFYRTDENYLYRWNGSTWEKVMHTDFGSSFPASPETGDTYYHTGYEQTFYYNGTNWIPFATIARAGTSFPTYKVEGDIFYRTDLNEFYRWNGSSWIAVHPKIGAGTSFPSLPSVGDLFYRSDENLLYRYNGAAWKRVIQTTGEGTSFPASPQVGDLFYRTDLNVLYRYDGAAWKAVHHLSTHGTTFPSSPTKGDFFYNENDNYLYRYNGTNWIKVMHQASGTSWPSSPEVGDTFYHNNYEQTFYWNGSSWKPLATISRSGPTTPPAEAVEGDIWLNTTTKQFYRHDGTNWIAFDCQGTGTCETLCQTTGEGAFCGPSGSCEGSYQLPTSIRNEVTNPSFEYGTWGGDETHCPVSKFGQYCAQMIASQQNKSSGWSNYIDVRVHEKISLGVWLRILKYAGSFVGTFLASVNFYDANKSPLTPDHADWVNIDTWDDSLTQWTKYTKIYTIADDFPDNVAFIRLHFAWWNAAGNPNGDAYIDGVQANFGDQSPAFQDFTTYSERWMPKRIEVVSSTELSNPTPNQWVDVLMKSFTVLEDNMFLIIFANVDIYATAGSTVDLNVVWKLTLDGNDLCKTETIFSLTDNLFKKYGGPVPLIWFTTMNKGPHTVKLQTYRYSGTSLYCYDRILMMLTGKVVL